MTMFSAMPVRHQGAVTGAVVASQSTLRLLSTLYAIRLRTFEIVVASIAVAALLTALAATTVVRPLTRLRTQSSTILGDYFGVAMAFSTSINGLASVFRSPRRSANCFIYREADGLPFDGE